MYKNILFDLDGTLVNSKPGIALSLNYAFGRCGISYDGDVEKFIGPPFVQSFPYYLGTDEETTAKLISEYRAKYNEVGMYRTTLYRGIRSLLTALHGCKKVALATTKPRYFAEIILRQKRILELFDFVGGSEPDAAIIDKDDVLAHIFKETDFLRSETVLVGDTKYDCMGAANAGIDCIGVTYGFGTKAELNAKYIVSSVAELKKLLL